MSQYDFGTIDPYVVDGVQLAGMLNNWRTAVHSWHRGATRPAYVVPGMMWIDDSAGAANWVVKVYLSPTVGDVAIFNYNTTTGIIASPTATWRRLGRVVPAAAQTTVDFQALPADINDLMLTFDVTPTTNAQELVLQFYDNTGTIDGTTAHYAFAVTLSQHSQTAGAAPAVYSSTAAGYSSGLIINASTTAMHVGNVSGIRGRAMIPNIRDARVKAADWQAQYVGDTATYVVSVVGSGHRVTATAITGTRLGWSASTFAAGGAVSLWGSP